ncbi:SUKH-4 family immunity protein [Lentzea sp. NPDC055074]
MSDRVLYPEAVTAVLASVEARAYLRTEGLPASHELVDVFQPGDVVVEEHPSGRTFLVVGGYEDLERYCVDVGSGAVVVVSGVDGSVWHLNASAMAFARSLDAFTAACPFGSAEWEAEEFERVAEAFREQLREIDPTSLSEDPGYWHSLLHDIAIGDYVEEELG